MSERTIINLLTCLGAYAFLALAACTKSMPTTVPIPVEKGVSRQLAAHRKQVVNQLSYKLHFNLPASRTAPISSSETITFHLKDNSQPLQLDFKEKSEKLKQLKINGQSVAINHQQEHLLLATRYLKLGKNEILLDFEAGNLSLNRSEEFLYTLLVPDRARTLFPCFDQPDLKAIFQLTLTLPVEWQALANGPLQDAVVAGGQKTIRYFPSDTISTYLFSFAAGKFERVTRVEQGRQMHFYHRETDQSKIKLSLDPIFHLHGQALDYMEKYTQIPYPFRKFDFVAIPDFQYNGMEHVGAIQYKAASLFLDEGATHDQKIARSSLISHETAHMWFGDLVTMEWFNDVWMKEVFANFMADKITQVSMPESNYDLKFLVDHFPAAYNVDRTAGANPIRQKLENLQDAGTLYGSIIYHKAPVVMRQLERLMGEEELRMGLQEYLQTYAYGNASWPDLIRILDARTSFDLEKWSQVWVSEPGRPVLAYELLTAQGMIQKLKITQQGEDRSDREWPQLFEVALVYPDRVEEVTVSMSAKEVEVSAAAGKGAPLFLLFNSSGQGYGVFPVDKGQLPELYRLPNPVMRASAYINLYENMLNNRSILPVDLLALYRQGLLQETEELNLKLLTGQLESLFWKWLRPEQRAQVAAQLEQEVWQALLKSSSANNKKLLFKTYQSIATSAAAQARLHAVWEKEQGPEGVRLTEEDFTGIAIALAVRDYAGSEQLLQKQLQRIENPDRQKRLEFMLPALSGNVAVRDAFFQSLKAPENREREAWVTAALSYLHHPLHTATSVRYLQESLELVEEIQLTGDIFFPQNWLGAIFASYRSPEAARVVEQFLAQNRELNPKLRAKVLQATDGVLREVHF